MLRLIKKILIGSLWHTIGRRNIIRLSRFLSNHARFDLGNDPQTNGEHDVQRWTLEALQGTADTLTVFDVGANVGRWTQTLFEAARDLPGDLRVEAFEPLPHTAEQLQSNLKSWGLGEKTKAQTVALSSEAGESFLFTTPLKSEISSMHAIMEDDQATKVPIRLDTVDHHCAQSGIERLHFLKIDAEGHDAEVLAGAQRMLSEGTIDVIQFEYNHRWINARHILRDAFELLEPHGYAVGKISPRGIEFAPWHWDMELFRESNYLAVRRELVEKFPTVPCWRTP